MKIIGLFLVLFVLGNVLAQTPPDKRGLGVEKPTPTPHSQTATQAREAKPELVLQTGYNNIFGATRLVFSPDGKLLATGTMRSNTIKLWETATNRKLRELSSSGQSGSGLAPSIAFSRDNRLIAASAADNSVKVWDVNSGRELHTLAGPQGTLTAAFGVYFIGFAADNRLVTVSDVARIWDLNTGREVRTLEMSGPDVSGFTGTDGAVALSPDGAQLVLLNDDEGAHVQVVDLSSGREARRVKLSDRAESVQFAFGPDGHLHAAGVVEQRLKIWNLNTKKEQNLAQTVKDFTQVKFSRDGRLVALAENYIVKIWEVATGRELIQLKVPNSGAFTTYAEVFMAFSEDGKRVVTSGFDTDTIVWETETGKRLSNLSGRTNMAYNVAFSTDGTQLSSGGRTRWDLRTGRGVRIVPATPEKTYGVPSPDGRLVAVMKLNSNLVSLLESPSGRQLHQLAPSGEAGIVEKLRFNPEGTQLAVVHGAIHDQGQAPVTTTSYARGSQVKIYDVKTGREIRSLAANETPSEVEFSSDGRVIATIGMMGQSSLWDAQSGSKLRDLTASPMSTFTPPAIKPGQMPSMPNMAELSAMMTTMMGTLAAGTMGRTVTSLAFSPDGRLLVTGGVESKSNIDFGALMSGKRPKGSKTSDPQDFMKDLKVEAIGQVQIWDVASGREVGALKGHGRAVGKVAFSPDGKLLATGGTDNTIKIWDFAAKRELMTLTGHTANIESLDFSPDGRLMASAGEDGSTFLWDAKTGEHLLTLISLDDGAEWMVVTPQGLFDGTPVSWNQILWRYNQETFNVAPIEWFFNEFYYPGLLSDVYGGKRPKVAQDVSKKDRRQPVVKLSLVGPQNSDTAIAARTIKVKIDITDAPADKDNPQGTGARDVRLFRNGSLVKVWHGDVLKGQPSISLEEEITVTAGPNRLVAYGFNRDNVKSKDAPLVFTGAESLKRKGTAYIIAVGINEYANTQYNLKYATADAQSFGDEIRRRQAEIGEFERVEVVQLLDKDATKANILTAIKRLAGEPGPPSLKAGPFDALKRVEPEDTVIIYYAGHGTAQSQRFYLIPHDLGYTGDRTKLTEDGLKTMLAHSISDLELEAAVEGLDAGHLLLIIDACNSGQALEAEEKRRGPMNSKGLAQLAYEKGMYILTAAQSFQAALEAAQLGHGYLTYALVEEGLKTPVADTEPKDGVLIAREWLNFATERVPQMQQEKMTQGRGLGLAIAFTEGETNIADPQKRSVQRPRVFYRRELEATPLVIAKP